MWIELPYGGRENGFDAEELVAHVATLGGYIIQGQQVCVLADHTKPLSLDYWLRTQYAATPDTKQAVNSVMDELVATGWFAVEEGLVCPTSGRKCKGLMLTEDGRSHMHTNQAEGVGGGKPVSYVEVTNDNKIEILRTMHDAHRAEVTHHRDIQFRVFSWSTGLFLAMIASILAIGTDWGKYRDAGAPILSTMVAAVLLTSLLILRRSAQALESNARVIVNIDTFLGLFHEGHYVAGTSVYSQSWRQWGTQQRSASVETWYYSVTVSLLGAILVALGWAFG